MMRKYIIGGLVGAALMFGIQAGAAGIVGSKVAGTKDVTLNGKTVGQAVIINNSSYLPVRSLSNALDLGIDLSGGKINLSEQETNAQTSAPSATPTPTPSPSSAPQYTIDEINANINVIQNNIKIYESMVVGFDKTGDTGEEATNIRTRLADLKAQLTVWEQRKAELEGKPQIFDVVLSGE